MGRVNPVLLTATVVAVIGAGITKLRASRAASRITGPGKFLWPAGQAQAMSDANDALEVEHRQLIESFRGRTQ